MFLTQMMCLFCQAISQMFLTQVIVFVLSGNITNVFNTSDCVGFVRDITSVYNTSDCVGFVRQYLKRL